MFIQLTKRFLQLESASALILFMAALLALAWVNSPLAYLHQQFIEKFLFFINEGLMALFFLMVGLEMKRGYLDGHISISEVGLPFIAALGGMLVPAFLYGMINYSNPQTLQGWATPVATDIAFALGVLSLFGRRVPVALKLFLLVLAIFDDMGAIIIIAVYYNHGLSYFYLCCAAFILILLFVLNHWSVTKLWAYLILGVLLWICLFYAGIHPTIAGVFLALTIPDLPQGQDSLLNQLENRLHPWTAYAIMPLFALANAGVSCAGLSWKIMTDSVVLGIIAGLFLGKQLGVFLFSWGFIKLKLAKLPEKSSWLQLYGVCVLCGIGFTMSLFLGTLSFANDNNYLVEVRLGVIIGSLLSGLVGAIILLFAFPSDETRFS
jgi:NhaA family Na+:H+ antiporter